MTIETLTTKNFAATIEKNELLVISFCAVWCKPCHAFLDVMNRLTDKHPDVFFGSIDIEKECELAKDFNISSVPSVMIIKKQSIVYADSGAMSPSALEELIIKAQTLDV